MHPWREVFGEVLFWGGLATMILGMVGEALGWWNDLGVALTVGGGVGSIIGGLIGLRALFDRTGSALVNGVVGLHGKQDQMLGKQDALLDKQDTMLDKQDLAMERFEHLIEVEENVLALLDERLPRA